MTLDELSIKYETDKGSLGHYYTFIYEQHFGERRKEALNLLEIGVAKGASLYMWRDYFPNAKIFGIDCDPECAKVKGDRITVFIGREQSHPFLSACLQEIYGGVDILIDDGKHFCDAQRKAFSFLFPLLNKKGIYCIEDTWRSYYRKCGRTYPEKEDSLIAYVKELTNAVNYKYHKTPTSRHDKLVSSIHFYTNFVIVHRR